MKTKRERFYRHWPETKALGFKEAGIYYEENRTIIMFADAAGIFRFWDMEIDKWIENYNSATAYRFIASGVI